MRTLVPALTSECYRTLAKSLNFPGQPGADKEKELLVVKILEALEHKRPKRKKKYFRLNPGNL